MVGSTRQDKVSIHSIASAAGTSVGTVSNVINHPERVSPQLKERVEKVMREKHFWPDATARALKIGRSPLVGTVFFDISNPFFAEAAHEIDKRMQMYNSSMIVAGTEQNAEREAHVLESLEAMGVNGIIITSTGSCWDILAAFQDRGVPVILLAQRSLDERFEAVGINDYRGMRKVARHLVSQGMNRFCFINDRIRATQHMDRWRGFCDELVDSGMDPDGVRVEWASGATWDVGYQRVGAILELPSQQWPECVVCLNDYIAMGASKAIVDKGLRVGSDISVTGFDDVPYASVFGTPLTTVRQPIPEMCRYVTNQVLDAVERGDGAVTGRTFEAELVIRESA